MSFPVLQRMDRKRPEMIQPISWQAEAMKGLAQGLQTGMQMANTINHIKLQNAANVRDEQMHNVNIKLAQANLTGVNLLNKDRMIESQMKDLYLQGETNYQLQQQGVRANGLLFDYTTGMSRMDQWMSDVGQQGPKIPVGINEALRTGYLQKLTLDAPTVLNTMSNPGASVADKYVAYNSFKDQVKPLFGSLKGIAATLDPKHPVRTSAATLLPFENDDTLWNNTTMTISVKADRSESEMKTLLSGLVDKEGNPMTPQQAAAETKPVNVKVDAVVAALRRGYFIEDMAQEVAGASNPAPFMDYLKKSVPETHYNALAARVDALRGIAPAVDGVSNSIPSSLLSKDKTALDSVPPKMPETRVTKNINGRDVTITLPKTIFDSISAGVKSVKNWLVDKINTDTESDILNEIGEIANAAARTYKDEPSHILARYTTLKRELNVVKSLQEEAAADENRIHEANKYAGVIRKLGSIIIDIEKETSMSDGAMASMPSTPLAAPATAGAGNEVPSFSTVAQAEAANLPRGTIVLINGKRAIIE